MTGRKRDRGARTGRRLGAACAATALVVSVCGVGTGAAADANSAGGGRTVLADDSGCTTKKDSPKLADDQQAVPWEISNAGTSGSAVSGTGKGVTVAIIDTGIAGSDSQVAHNVVGGKDFTGSGGDYKSDVDGHGTLVASIIAAKKSTRNAMAGIAPDVRLLIYREAGCNVPKGSDEATLAKAIDQAVSDGAQIINVSQDGYTANSELKKAVVNAFQKNVLIVASAGNNGDKAAEDNGVNYGINPVMYPAAYAPYLLAVGASSTDNSVPSFSETGPYISVTAPGDAIGGLFPDGKIWTISGTSFAAPYVSAVAALLLEKHPSWTVDTLIKVLEATASGTGSWSSSAGWGSVKPLQALEADPNRLTKLFGAGPNADGPAQAKPVNHGAAMAPYVDAAPAQTVVNQHKGAYIALGSSTLAVIVMLAGVFIARDARRRRLTT